MNSAQVLFCIEDPGASNYLASLPAALEKAGVSSVVYARPAVSDMLSAREVRCVLIPADFDAVKIIDHHAPALAVVGTSELSGSLAHALVDHCRIVGVPTVAGVDMAANADRRFKGDSRDPLHHAPDWLWVPDESTETSFLELGFPADNILVCGHPHFDWVRECRRHFEQTDRSALRRRWFPANADDDFVILFVAEGVDLLNPAFSYRHPGYALRGRGENDFRTLIVLEELLDAAADADPGISIAVRPHPKSNVADFDQYHDELAAVCVGGDPLEVVWAADAVAGMTSMLLVEAYLLGRQTLSVLPDRSESALLPTTASGITPVCSDRGALRTALKEITVHTGRIDDGAGCSALPHDALQTCVEFILTELRRTTATDRQPHVS